jgi:DNA-binding response OmpR family regulator
MPHTLLVIEDQAPVRAMLCDYLGEHGYLMEQAADGVQGLAAARRVKPDLILLDIMMPNMDGYEFIKTYRREHATPILLLTAKVEETDKVVGLELGADDYVTKPFGLRELLARVRTLLRRAAGDAGHEQLLRAADIVLDRDRHRVEVAGREVALTPTEFELLATLMAAPSRVFQRITLLERLQGFGWEGVERTVDVHVRNLRSKIEPDPAKPKYVQTVFGVGYRFAPPE